MVADQLRLSDTDRANLVAYLDHELTEPESRTLATKLTHSVSARREVEVLERTWGLLDHLPRPSASPQLAEQTLSEVAQLGLGAGDLTGAAGRVAKLALRMAACLATAAATLFFGYACTHWIWPDPTARLAQDLSLAEHLDEYQEIGTIEFLKQLDDSPYLYESAD